MMKIPRGGDVVDCPTQLICISDIYVTDKYKKNIPRQSASGDGDGKNDDEEDVDLNNKGGGKRPFIRGS